ncbi:splicing factor, arginine/serine-rich 15 isoform X2 [Melanaphis sacchari]|uniref:splicing factor, arginine/serine-rich 15 isoform X2 n=1 Tax=Melanaphis sacchari TaxID=742174 RepID=UPI000DC12E86|nr:splicing factor, arginine/serine-rich 15 isoform X2 [Melanaphis sacchari]
MEAVKAFTFELYSIMEMKPPISKAKMTAITRNAIKAIKLYKHVVQCVEKFIQKCKPEYKIPGLYVIDSIVRQSRHQFGNDKDVFAPRFARNLKSTFTHLFACPEEDKSKVIRVLNLWQKNAVFTTDIIQPIFDLAANPDYGEHSQINSLSSMDTSPKISVKTDLFKSQDNTPVKDDMSKNFDTLQSQSLDTENKPIDPAILEHIQAIQSLLKKQPGHMQQSSTSPQVKKSDAVKLFDKKILDYDYGDEEDEMLNQSPVFHQQQHQNTTIDGIDSLLNNPEVLRTLRNVEGLMSTQSKQLAELDKIKEMRKEAEFDKHLAQTVQNLPFASECELKPAPVVSQAVGMMSNPYVNQLFSTQMYQQQPMMSLESHHKPLPQIIYDDSNQSKPEVIDLDHIASPPQNKRDTRRDGYSSGPSRKRSPRKNSRERQREREKEREKDRERRKKYLPPFKKNHLAVVSTTLWVGHLSKLIHQDDLYGLFQPIGDIVSLNLISPRGCAFLCMNRRQDAARIMSKYQGERLQGKPMTIAWAPGQAMKDKEWKDYWEIDDGVSYIPWEKLNKEIDYDELEVGGMLDEDTMPEWLKTHLKNLRTSKKNEKKEEEKVSEGSQQPLNTSNFFDPQGVQSPSVQNMQMSPAQNSQPNQMNFNMPQTMNMPNPFGINPRLINPMMNPMMPGTMAPMGMGHPSMMMMNRMPSPFGPPPNMSIMGNPQQMAMSNDAQKPLGVPPDMMMSFPFAAAISSAQTMMGLNPPTVTSGTSTAPTLSQNTSHKDNLNTTNPPNQLDPSTLMQFNLPPPPTLPNLSDFARITSNTNISNEKYDPNILGNSETEDSKDSVRNIERDDRIHGIDHRNRNYDNRERIDKFSDRDIKNDRGRRDDLSQRQDPRNRIKGPEQRERKSSRWGDKVNEEVDNPNNIDRLSIKEGLGIAQVPNIAQIDNVKDILMQNNSLHQILDHVIQDNMGNPPFQPGIFGPNNGPLPNQMFNMPPQNFPQDGPRPPVMENSNMRGRGGWNRGGRGGFRGRGGYNPPNWDNNNGPPNWDTNSGPNWDNNGPPPVWQNQSMNRGGMMGRSNLRPPLMQNVMGRGRDNWMGNNLSANRSNRDSDKWVSRGGSRDSDGWSGRSRLSPWRGNGNRRRNEDWEGPNQQKRWRRDDNPEWDEQQKPWKRGTMNEEEERQNIKQGSSWAASKLKNRDNNDERSKKPSKWGDKESDDNTKGDRWNKKSVEHTSSVDEVTAEEGPHQTSGPMDLDNYEGEGVDNIEQLHKVQDQETVSSNMTFRQHDEIENKEDQKDSQEHHEFGVHNADSNNEDKNVEQNNEEQLNRDRQFGDYQNDLTNNSQELFHDNIKETQQISQKTPVDNFEQQNFEEKQHDEYQPHEEYQKDTTDNFNSQRENEIRQNNEDFEQNVQFKSDYNDTKYENDQPNNHQSFNEESSHNLNNDEHYSDNAIESQVNEANQVMNIEEKSCEPRDDFYYGADCESSFNMEQQNNEILPIEETVNVPTDNEINDINTAELNQS